MDKVIDIREQIDRREQGRRVERYREKVQAIHRFMHSSEFKPLLSKTDG